MSIEAKTALIQHSFIVPGADPTLAFWTAELSAMGLIAQGNGEIELVWTCPESEISPDVLLHKDNPVKAAALSALCYHLYASSVTAQRYANMKEGLSGDDIIRERGQV